MARNIIHKTEQVNFETGEVKTSTTSHTYRSDEPNYIKLYLQDISLLFELPKAASELMMELLNYVTYGTQEIVLNATTKKRISDVTGLAVQTINNRLTDLTKKGVLNKVDTGVFQLNPYLFGKGDWKTIRELREQNVHLKITYDAKTNTRKIQGHVDE